MSEKMISNAPRVAAAPWWKRDVRFRLLVSIIAALLFPAPTASGDPEVIRIEGTTVSFELVDIAPGTLRVGEEQVEIGSFAVASTEVTWDLYDIFLYGLDVAGDEDSDGVSRPSKPYVPPDRGYGHAGYPAMGMTRHAAVEFCKWLSQKTGDRYRLPTKEEWHFLAVANGGERGGIWHEQNADFSTQPVAKLAPNSLGLFDMLGNVAEWVAPGEGERPQDNPVAMGGSFLEPVDACSASAEQLQTADWNVSDPQIPKSRWWLADCDFVGFRVVREQKPEQAIEQEKSRE